MLYEVITNVPAPLQPTLPVAYYRFDGDALDSSGNANHGTATGVIYSPGRIGTEAAQFNGTSAHRNNFV